MGTGALAQNGREVFLGISFLFRGREIEWSLWKVILDVHRRCDFARIGGNHRASRRTWSMGSPEMWRSLPDWQKPMTSG